MGGAKSSRMVMHRAVRNLWTTSAKFATMPSVTLVEMLRKRRAALSLTQAEAARMIGVSRQSYETWESRTDLVPRLGHVAGIAQFLRVQPSVILEMRGSDPYTLLDKRLTAIEKRLDSAGL